MCYDPYFIMLKCNVLQFDYVIISFMTSIKSPPCYNVYSIIIFIVLHYKVISVMISIMLYVISVTISITL